jgi:hypothetical protein
MFELHVVVAAVVMLNILELIMEIVPNYPTACGPRIELGYSCLDLGLQVTIIDQNCICCRHMSAAGSCMDMRRFLAAYSFRTENKEITRMWHAIGLIKPPMLVEPHMRSFNFPMIYFGS